MDADLDPLDEEGLRLLAVANASHARERIAAHNLKHPVKSMLYLECVALHADLEAMKIQSRADATAFREHRAKGRVKAMGAGA